MRSRSAFALLALLVTSCLLAAVDGCTIVNGLVVESDSSTDAPVVGMEGGDALPSDGCDHLRPPPPPNVPDTADNLSVVAVAKQIILSTPAGSDPLGYDLDDTCSGTAGAPETCTGPNHHLDLGGRGVDNNAGSLFTLVNSRTDLEPRVNAGILMGQNTVLLQITGYNGKLDDPKVTISVYAAIGLLDGSGNNVPPQFLESEKWTLDQRQFTALAPDIPVTTTVDGYVTNGVLVGTLINPSIAISASFSVMFKGGIVTAELDLSGAKPVIKSALIAGRWPATDILRAVARQRTSDAGAVLCNDATNYGFAKTVICQQLDIMADQKQDRKDQTCDATSASLRFVMAPGGLGPHVTQPIDEPCPGFPADSCTPDGG